MDSICFAIKQKSQLHNRSGRRSAVAFFCILQKNTIETTGAGDTFCGCVLHYICEHGLDNLTEADLTSMLTFANAAAARITTRKGALRVMPDRAEIEKEIVSR